ncbi:flagellar brake protein [Vibrio panuliri]|uniref:Cation tolerance protein CutA n=1 Tax=Vibrio panuliri TaxID=1381081 RepID=A0ABX3FC73_9VIBR|nr:flagellar brake protein [Vibrio panuliri]KAB1458181.1 flagellar brake protein [Vibrio panuliri]OLQ89435.1 cation tolerance protein CutA [Vibrio panuliri]
MNTLQGTSSATSAQQNGGTAQIQTTIKSIDGLAMLDHGRELSVNIVTPVGTGFRAKSNLIGTHSNHMILLELPKLNEDKLQAFFQEGFWATINAISPRGEGAVLTFRSQILHVIRTPIAMIAMSIPQTMQAAPLRNEPRYEVSLNAKAHSTNHRIDCDIKDLSKSGCLYVTSSLSRPFSVGETVELHLSTEATRGQQFQPLTGRICNVKQASQKRRYGVMFNDEGKKVARALLDNLKFDGSKLSLQ